MVRHLTLYIGQMTQAVDTLKAYRQLDKLPASEPARVALLFGLKNAERMSDLRLADQVARGFPVKAAETIEPVFLLISRDALHRVVSESTLRRARKAKTPLTREPSARLYEVARVIDQAARTFHGDGAAVGRFLNRPNPALEGRAPFDVAKSSSAGAEAVVRLLREAQAGVAV